MADDNESYNMDAVLDGIEDQDGDLHLTSKTVSHFYHERVVVEEIKNLASYPMVGPSPLDNRERWHLRISLMRYVITQRHITALHG